MTRNGVGRELRETAYHEAGHAVSAWLQHLPIKSVSIIPDGADSLGCVVRGVIPDTCIESQENFREGYSFDRLDKEVENALAGRAAVQRWQRRKLSRMQHSSCRADYCNAADIASHITGLGKGLSLYLAWVEYRADCRMKVNWRFVRALAEELLRRRKMSGRAVRKFLISVPLRTAQRSARTKPAQSSAQAG